MATARERYLQLAKARNEVLRQAREAAKVTIPGLIPEEGSSNPHDVAVQPYTSLGARGVNNLSAKLLLSQFPPERPFFRQEIDADILTELGAQRGDAEAQLAGISRKAMLLSEPHRPLWMEVFRHLIVAGNMLVYAPLDGLSLRLWRLDQYVVRRNAKGQMLEAITREEVYPSELDPATVAATKIEFDPEKPDSDKIVDLYTYVKRVGDSIEHFEEINGFEVPGSRGKAKVDEAGWQALRWQAVPGSDYGRSYVSEYAGDFLSLEDASKSILQFAAAAARIINIVDPNSGIDIEELSRAESGDFLNGFRDKIQTLQLDKSQDFQVVWKVAEQMERRLSQAFLLTSNTIRDAERVTAEEIRAVAQELEDSFGGTYSVISTDVQAPYARRLLHILARSGAAPKLPATVSVRIVTGFAALGRNHETAALRDWLVDLKDNFGENWVIANVQATEVAKRLGVGRGVVGVEELLKDPAAVAQEQQEGLASQAALNAAPQLAKVAGDAMNQGTAPNVQP